MDPRAYCQEAILELLARRARRGGEPDSSQHIIVLSYLLEQRLSVSDFERQLEDLAVATRHGQPGVAAAAQAILVDWREQARDAAMVPASAVLDAVPVPTPSYPGTRTARTP